MTPTEQTRDIRVVAPSIGLALLQLAVTGLALLFAFWDAFSQIACTECFPAAQTARWVLTGALVVGWAITLAGIVTGYIRQRARSWAPLVGSAVILGGYLRSAASSTQPDHAWRSDHAPRDALGSGERRADAEDQERTRRAQSGRGSQRAGA